MKYEVKIKLNNIAILMFILSMFEPQYIVNFVSPIHYLFRLAYYGSFALMLIDYIRKPIEKDQIPIFVCIVLYFLCRVISTVLYSGLFNISNIRNFLSLFIRCIGVLYISRELKNCASFIINCILIWGEVIIYINFITILVFPNGIWQSSATGNACYFLGHKNQLYDYIILPLLCSFIYHYNSKRNPIRMWALWLAVMLSSYISSSDGTFLVSCCCFLPVLQITLKKYNLKISIFWAIFVSLLLNILIVFFGIQSSFDWLFDVTFTGRTAIWENVINLLPQRLILGWGSYFGNLYGTSIFKGLSGPHNGLLAILGYGGLIGFIVWIITNILTIVRGKKYKNNYISSIFAVLFFAFYLHGIVEASYDGINMYILFILAMNIKYISKATFNKKRVILLNQNHVIRILR